MVLKLMEGLNEKQRILLYKSS